MNRSPKKRGLLLLAVLSSVVLSGLGSGYCLTNSTNVVINEFMASNQSTIQNSLGNYSDWIELYNPTDAQVVLDGIFLTDEANNLKWQFTNSTSIAPHGYLLVWADGNVRYGCLHTNFKLDKAGGTLTLIAADGSTVLDSVVYSKQVSDVSLGRTVDGGSNWNYLSNPTPGEANGGFSALFLDYPWQIWLALFALVLVAVLVVFRDKLRLNRGQINGL